MAITLDPSLKTAQDSSSHHPIIEVISRSLIEEIPFDGQYLTTETTDEQRPNLIMHSSGRVCNIFTFGTNNFRFVTTTEDKTEFRYHILNKTNLGCASGITLIEATLCELNNDDNDIGIVFLCSDGNNYYLRQAIIDIDGNIISTALIDTYSKLTYSYVRSPYVIRLINNTYYLVYILYDDDDTSIIYKRTSADFSAWGAEAAIVMPDTTDYIKENISLCQYTWGSESGKMLLLFDSYDGNEWLNCYYSLSTDNGATWGQAQAITSYDNASASGKHPIAYQSGDSSMTYVFYEQKTSFAMGPGTDGWPDGPGDCSDITIDVERRRIYCTCSETFTGNKDFTAIVEINIDTLEVVKYWNLETVPAFSEHFSEESQKNVWWLSHQGEYPYIPVGERTTHTGPTGYEEANGWHSPVPIHIEILNVETDEIDTIEYYGIEFTLNNWLYNEGLVKTLVKDGKLYALSGKRYAYNPDGSLIHVAVYDLATGEPTYEDVIGLPGVNALTCLGLGSGKIDIDDAGRIWISFSNALSTWFGGLLIYDPAHTLKDDSLRYSYKPNGAPANPFEIAHSYPLLLLNLRGDEYPTKMPYRGITSFERIGHKLYCVFPYDNDYESYRGICVIDLEATGIVLDQAGTPENPSEIINNITTTFLRPSWATLDNYGFNDITSTDDGRLLISGLYGISIYDPDNNTWEILNNDTIPGFTPDASNVCLPIKYDPVNNMAFTGIPKVISNSFQGVLAVPLDGYIQKTYYEECSIAEGGAPVITGEVSELIQGYRDYDTVVVRDDTDGSIFAFWTNYRSGELSIKWDHDRGLFDLTPYLLSSVDVTLKWSIDNRPGEFSFGVSHGHLFDPYNIKSLLSVILARDRKITVRIGETVGGIEKWQNQGTFYVREFRMSGYSRGEYPSASIKCEDMMCYWKDFKVVTTDYYSNDPEYIIEDILENDASVDSDDIDELSFDNSITIYRQWLDSDVMTIISEICDRFGHFVIVDMDNIITCRLISDEADIDHTYSDLEALIEWTPDHEYADSVNQITVIGEERDFNEIQYPEESIITQAGTTGWWSGGERIACFYSEDKSRKCYFPRVEWISQPTGLGLWQDGVDMYVEEHDDQLGCDLIVDADNLVAHLLALVALITAKFSIPDGLGEGETIPIGRVAEGALLILIMDALMTITNWQATIYARPVGSVRRTVQATANDIPYQEEIDKIIPLVIEEPMCYMVDECQNVANHEIMLKRLQRHRIKLTKIMHLQDEVGDTIRIIHPYGEHNVDIFITSLTRQYKKASIEGKNDGYCKDSIEGWVIT